jgi:hypothetical protein
MLRNPPQTRHTLLELSAAHMRMEITSLRSLQRFTISANQAPRQGARPVSTLVPPARRASPRTRAMGVGLGSPAHLER